MAAPMNMPTESSPPSEHGNSSVPNTADQWEDVAVPLPTEAPNSISMVTVPLALLQTQWTTLTLLQNRVQQLEAGERTRSNGVVGFPPGDFSLHDLTAADSSGDSLEGADVVGNGNLVKSIAVSAVDRGAMPQPHNDNGDRSVGACAAQVVGNSSVVKSIAVSAVNHGASSQPHNDNGDPSVSACAAQISICGNEEKEPRSLLKTAEGKRVGKKRRDELKQAACVIQRAWRQRRSALAASRVVAQPTQPPEEVAGGAHGQPQAVELFGASQPQRAKRKQTFSGLSLSLAWPLLSVIVCLGLKAYVDAELGKLEVYIDTELSQMAHKTKIMLPHGVIMQWSGSVTSIPEGWALCDGTLGTPNLVGRFALGAGNGTEHATGGQWETQIRVQQLPPHGFTGTTSPDTHSHNFDRVPKRGPVKWKRGEFNEPRWGGEYDPQWDRVSTSSNSHSHTFSTETIGGGEQLSIANPYYSLAFIMKLELHE